MEVVILAPKSLLLLLVLVAVLVKTPEGEAASTVVILRKGDSFGVSFKFYFFNYFSI